MRSRRGCGRRPHRPRPRTPPAGGRRRRGGAVTRRSTRTDAGELEAFFASHPTGGPHPPRGRRPVLRHAGRDGHRRTPPATSPPRSELILQVARQAKPGRASRRDAAPGRGHRGTQAGCRDQRLRPAQRRSAGAHRRPRARARTRARQPLWHPVSSTPRSPRPCSGTASTPAANNCARRFRSAEWWGPRTSQPSPSISWSTPLSPVRPTTWTAASRSRERGHVAPPGHRGQRWPAPASGSAYRARVGRASLRPLRERCPAS